MPTLNARVNHMRCKAKAYDCTYYIVFLARFGSSFQIINGHHHFQVVYLCHFSVLHGSECRSNFQITDRSKSGPCRTFTGHFGFRHKFLDPIRPLDLTCQKFIQPSDCWLGEVNLLSFPPVHCMTKLKFGPTKKSAQIRNSKSQSVWGMITVISANRICSWIKNPGKLQFLPFFLF